MSRGPECIWCEEALNPDAYVERPGGLMHTACAVEYDEDNDPDAQAISDARYREFLDRGYARGDFR